MSVCVRAFDEQKEQKVSEPAHPRLSRNDADAERGVRRCRRHYGAVRGAFRRRQLRLWSSNERRSNRFQVATNRRALLLHCCFFWRLFGSLGGSALLFFNFFFAETDEL